MKIKYLFLIIIAVLITVGAVYSLSNQITNDKLGSNIKESHSYLGSDDKGHVTKEVYYHSGASGPKIAIITGMHPREISAKTVVPEVIKDYVSNNDVEIVNYQINVTNDPGNFKIGRHNGEGLVAKYVIPDIAKSNYNLVIICHNHRQGYGNGYYIATPTMDSKSVSLAESVHNLLPGFNYYKRNVDQKPEETSIKGVDAPIVSTGTPVFVYEAPEWLNNSDVYDNTDRLINVCFKVIG